MYIWYIYLHENPKKSTIHVGVYTSPMDPMGYGILVWYMGVNPKIMGNPPNHPFVHRVFHEINHPFWGVLPPLFLG